MLKELWAQRLALHRLEPPRPVRDARAAAGFVKERRITMATGRSSLPSLTEAIAGRHLAGSWMAHPEVYRIYRILGRLEKYGVAETPLVLGKQVVMDASLGPAVERIASDPDRCASARSQLPPLAGKLLDRVEAVGRVRMDRWGVPTVKARRARSLLERALLIASVDIHTDSGYHTRSVIPWRTSAFSKRFSTQAARLTFDEAQDELLLAAVLSAVLVPEREVRRWFVVGVRRLEALLNQGKLTRLAVRGEPWLTCPQ